MAGQKDSLRWGSVILGFGLLALDAALDGVRRLCHRARLWPGPTKPIGALTNDEIDALP